MKKGEAAPGLSYRVKFIKTGQEVSREEGGTLMQRKLPARTCPACGSSDYVFRGRKRIAPDASKGAEAAIETKYHCRGCGHEWRDRVAVKEAG